MEAEPMHVLQFAKRSALMLAAAAVTLSGCGSESAPTVPFNPSGATDDIEAVNTAFNSQTFTDFAQLSLMFDAALGGAPLVSSSAQAIDLRNGGTMKGAHAAAARSAERIARIMPRPTRRMTGASAASIPPEYLGKTFIYSNGSYVVTAQTGAPLNGVRFWLYAVDPVTGLPASPLNQTGYVDLIDMSSETTSAARVVVVSGTTTYLDYRVNVTAVGTSGRVTVLGFITDGTTEATFNLRSTLTVDAGLTLSYSLDVPERDLSIDLTMSAEGINPELSTINVTMDMRGQNGWVRLAGEFSTNGGTLNVAINGTSFANITFAAGAEPAITGADGEPLAPEEVAVLQQIFNFTGGAFIAFDQLVAPVGMFLADPAA
jgi:hypothetical protein